MFDSAPRLTGWRKIANATWHGPNDPQVFGSLEIDATALRRFIERQAAAGHRVTPTTLVGKAVAHALRAVPEMNVRLLAGRAIPRPSIDVFFITAVGGGSDLSGVKVEAADRKSAVEIGDELRERAKALKEGRDPALAQAKRMMSALPLFALRPALRLFAWMAGDLAWSVPLLGVAPSPFGSAMVSSVGMLGIPTGYSPLAWLYRVPLLVLAGEIGDRAVVIDGRVEVRPILPITATIDHRYADGWQIATLLKAFRAYLAAPEDFDGAADAPRPRDDA